MGNIQAKEKAKASTSTGTSASLALLRTTPQVFFDNFGLFVRTDEDFSDNTGGPSRLSLARTPTANVFSIEVSAGGTDWYIPYQGQHAKFVDIPKGLYSGTLAVTFPMNGCALAVHEIKGGKGIAANRFFHDYNGKYMSDVPSDTGKEKFRLTEPTYAGVGRPLEGKVREISEAGLRVFNFEYCIVCVKKNDTWEVYSSAIVTYFNFENEKTPIWVNQNVPSLVGSFPD